MKKNIYIGCGGFIGAVLRYIIKGIQIYGYHENIPINTLLINVSGAFLMTLILTAALELWGLNSDIRLGITTGFLGAFTTFSTLCKETVGLFYQGDYYSAISYLTVSTVLGLGAAYLGITAARKICSKDLREKEKMDEIIDNESEAD